MDKLNAMAMFVAVVQEKGFAAAARRMGVSAPVATRAVSELEAALQVRLLVRTTRVVQVTEVGERYALDCQRVLNELRDIEQSATGSHGAVRGKLVITASSLFGRMRLGPVVRGYLERHPETEIECRYVDRPVNLLSEGIDVAIRIGELPDSSYHAVPLTTVRRVVCAAPDYLARAGVPRHPDELIDHCVIAALSVESGSEWKFTDGAEPIAAPVQPRLATSSTEHAIQAAVAGFGLTRVLDEVVREQLAAGSLVEVLETFSPPRMPVHALHLQGRRASNKVRAFIDLAIAHLRED
ncbi:LysR family transcriptional regulator [Roseateles chitinivorans]|uniref:LysR family transcriptional regulator n=1 Tax=Roseateles chitinivorans TaxID=2917965 RepID=UPI003D675D05